jgi:hypothetical protein
MRLWAIFWLVGGVLWASAAEVRMELSPSTIRMGDAAQLQVVLEGVTDGGMPEIPAVAGLRIGGPSVFRQEMDSVVNGRVERVRRLIYSFTVIPLQPGDYEVGPLTYTHDGKTYDVPAQPLRVVMPGDTDRTKAEKTEDLVFARISVSRDRVYVNDVFTLTIAVYAREVNLGRDIRVGNWPDTGIRWEQLQVLNPTREIVDGHRYDVRRYQTQVRPLTAGTIQFSPTLQVQLQVPRQQRRHPFFDDPFFSMGMGGVELHPLDLSVDPVAVNVRPVPEDGRPAGFSGGVGRFSFDTHIHPAEVRLGDPITVTLRVEGEGNIDTVGPPAVAESDLFRVYPPRVLQSDLNDAGTRGRKIYEQILIPRSLEAAEIPALTFSYFDPEAEQFRSIVRGPYRLDVQPAAQTDTPTGTGRLPMGVEPTEVVGRDIRHLQPEPVSWEKTADRRRETGVWFWLMQAIPLALVVGTFGWTKRRRALSGDVARARRYRAPKSARPALRKAEAALSANDENAFFEAVWAALTAYFGNRFNLPTGSITRHEVAQALSGEGADQALVERAENLFAVCDLRRFARHNTAATEMQELLEETRQLFKECERGRA